MLLSFIVPVAPYHLHLIGRAQAQVAKQTIPCAFIPVIDHDGRGAGWARNRGVERVETPFISFLDCDDFLDATYAETMLRYYKPGHYVYSDFYMGGDVVEIPEVNDLKDDKGHHLINCVMHVDIFRQTGGFDESRHLEDTRFWSKCLYRGVCGIRCPYPLVEYTGEGQRSKLARSDPQWVADYWKIFEEYPSMCKSCGKSTPVVADKGTQQPGDVLVVALWGGNRVEKGIVTRRQYPRTGNGKELWVDPRDAAARPDLFRVVPEPIMPEPDLDIIAALTQEKLNAPARERLNPVPSETPAPTPRSDVERHSKPSGTRNTGSTGQRSTGRGGNTKRTAKGRAK